MPKSKKPNRKKKAKQVFFKLPPWAILCLGLLLFILVAVFEADKIEQTYFTAKKSRESYELSPSTVIAKSDLNPVLYANRNQDDLQGSMVEAIGKAKSSVLLIVYGLTDPKIIDALRKKAEKGVSVTVICDAKANPQAPRKLGEKVTTYRRSGKGLMHQKILVVDNQQVWIGSANMTTESLKLHGNLMTSVSSQALAKMVDLKAQQMMSEKRSSPLLKQEFSLNNQQMEFWFLPDNKNASERILQLIEGAKKSIKIAMFTWTRKDFAKAVVTAARRGVEVSVVMDRYAGKGAGIEISGFLTRCNVPVAYSTGQGLLHYKMMIIDDSILVNGSANWTKAAFTQNDDCIMILKDLTTEQVNGLDRLWKRILSESKPVEQDPFEEAA